MVNQPAPLLTATELPLRASLSLPACAAAVPVARAYTRFTLGKWDMPAEVTGNAELIVSEFVTNAIKASQGLAHATVRVRLASDREQLLVQVWDAGASVPVLRDPRPASEGGRGLQLVAALSVNWGVNPAGTLAGKVVWAVIAAEERTQ
jgi:anti-sigma regulatory factor (Ser/Thr protein kinase)